MAADKNDKKAKETGAKAKETGVEEEKALKESDFPGGDSFGDRLNSFVQKNRGRLFGALIAAVLIAGGFIAAYYIRAMNAAKALGEAAALSRRYEDLRLDINEESKAEEVEALLADLASFAGNRKGFAAAQAWGAAAGIRMERKEWAEAETAYAAAAAAAKDTYLAPLSSYNAAVAAEEAGNREAAIGHYEECLQDEARFPQAARARFAIGRLREALDDKAGAVEAYRALVDKWPDDPLWSDLAQSRLILLVTE